MRSWLFISRMRCQACKPGWVSFSLLLPDLSVPSLHQQGLCCRRMAHNVTYCAAQPLTGGDTDGTPQPRVVDGALMRKSPLDMYHGLSRYIGML